MFTELNRIKEHIHITNDYTEEDEYLCGLASAAEAAVENHINTPLNVLSNIFGGELPSPVQHAILLLVATLYTNRESISYAQAYKVPHAYEYLLQPYVKYYY